MGFLQIILIAFGLAMDAFAVSIAAGAAGQMKSFLAAVRLSFHLGLFQFLMPVLGWYFGVSIEPLIADIDHWIAFFLLLMVGLRMIRSGLSGHKHRNGNDPTRGFILIMLSLATSIDAMAVGLSLAILQLNILYPSLVIGLITFILALVGAVMGHRLGIHFGRKMEIIGGLIIIFIGVKLLISHL